MIITIALLIIGIIIFIGGMYYFLKEKHDMESRKIYLITSIVGIIITLGVLIKLFLF